MNPGEPKARRRSSLYTVRVDLTGSNFPEARSVECVCEWPAADALDHLRYLAAQHYAVPLAQVGEPQPHQRVTHGRHCVCSACAREDWTNPGLASCGMHGASCPREYAPLGAPGEMVPSE